MLQDRKKRQKKKLNCGLGLDNPIQKQYNYIMQRVILQVPISKELKHKAEIASSDMGFSSLQEIIRVIVNKLARRELSISIDDEVPNERTRKVLLQAEKDWKAGKGSPIFKTGKEAVAWLEKQGI